MLPSAPYTIRAGLGDGSSVSAAKKSLDETGSALKASLEAVRLRALSAGRLLGKAVGSRHPARRAEYARAAYGERISAEGQKYRSAYLLQSVQERRRALDFMLKAQRSRDPKMQTKMVDSASNHATKADALDLAAEKTTEAIKSVPEPEMMSLRRARRLATASGIRLDKRQAVIEMALPGSAVQPSLVSPLLEDFYPDDITQVAGSLQGLGEVGQTGSSWLDSVKAALGVGVAAAGGAAVAAGQDAAKGNPAAGAAIAAAGGALSAIAATLGLQFNAGYGQGAAEPEAVEQSFPWAVVAIGGAAMVGGFLLWRRFR